MKRFFVLCGRVSELVWRGCGGYVGSVMAVLNGFFFGKLVLAGDESSVFRFVFFFFVFLTNIYSVVFFRD